MQSTHDALQQNVVGPSELNLSVLSISTVRGKFLVNLAHDSCDCVESMLVIVSVQFRGVNESK